MNWLREAFIEPGAIQTIVVISMVSAIGLRLGKLKLFGLSLGITFVFFTGIIVGHFGITLDRDLLTLAQNFGLILFVYTLGLQVGPGVLFFFQKRRDLVKYYGYRCYPGRITSYFTVSLYCRHLVT